jgi:hypothetical protein
METAKLSTDTNAHVSSTSNTCAGTRKLISSNYKNDTYDTHESATMGMKVFILIVAIFRTFLVLSCRHNFRKVLAE